MSFVHPSQSNPSHFMLQEIYAQPEVVQACLMAYSSMALPFSPPAQIHILASGSSRHAGLVAQYWFEQILAIPTRVRSASEFLSAPLPLGANTLTIAITQSGETADTLAAVKQQMQASSPIVGVTNQPASSLARLVNLVLPTFAGTETGIAATKTFTTQLAVLFCLMLNLARQLNRLDEQRDQHLLAELQLLPSHIYSILHQGEMIQAIARQFTTLKNCIVLGQGVNRAIALEGALKLKETTYIHAEGYAAGEFLHGPIALVDGETPVIAIAPLDHTYNQVMATVRKVKSYGASAIGIVSGDSSEEFDQRIRLPAIDQLLSPFLTVIPLQLLAYYIAVEKGLNVDKPRNLTKTVL